MNGFRDMHTSLFIICLIIQAFACIFIGWSGVVAVLGLTRKKKNSAGVSRFHRFAVIVCARNEANVLPNLMESLWQQNYPPECWHVYLLADHCTDATAEVGRRYPFVTVYERRKGPGTGKGAVLRFGISRLLKKKADSFDAVLVFDADNVANPDFMRRINESLCSGNSIVQGFRVAGEPFRTLVTKWYAIYWPIYSFCYSYPREKLGLSCFLTGTGFAVKKDLLKQTGWDTRSVTEDVEYAFRRCLEGGRASFCVDAVCCDEQPSDFSVMLRQLTRWCTGNYQILRSCFRQWFRRFREKPSASLFDNLTLLLVGPCSFISLAVTAALAFVTSRMPAPFFLIHVLLFCAGYVFTVIGALILMLYMKTGVRKVLPAILTFPVFLWIYSLCSFFSLLFPQTDWKPIAHRGISGSRAPSGRRRVG